ncbi:unnamed protein product [marine sediment metagenome]|uniref:Uncharacterized protein n=1 Tax=marine sediment metagenome TaxID=412755 RepID=X1RZA7_9ZZZZ
MNRDIRWKWAYSFLLFCATIGWAVFTIKVVATAMASPTPVDVLKASGTGILLGALITWNSTIIHFWFRKKAPEEK